MIEKYVLARKYHGGDKHLEKPSAGCVYDAYWVKAEDYAALEARCRDYKEALTWVIDNFNTFAQPPEHLKGIVDAACLAAMTSDTDMLRDTPETGAEHDQT